MKLKKILFIASIIIILTILSIFIILNININISINKNDKVVKEFNNIFKKQTKEVILDYKNNLPKLQLDNTDYVGVININNIYLPVEDSCSNKIFDINPACIYSDKQFIIKSTNLKNSLNSFKKYNIDDKVTFINMLGEIYEYKIKKIKRLDSLDNVSKYNEDLIIVIKNYYDMEYILFICSYY